MLIESKRRSKKQGYFLALLLSFLLCVELSAQEQRDLHAWTFVTLEYELADRWQLEWEQQVRLEDNARSLRVAFSEIGAAYKISKWMSASLAFRFSRAPGFWENRVMANVNLKKRFKPIDFSSRLRLQRSYQAEDSAEDYFRVKFRARYSRKKIKWRPYLAHELYYSLHSRDMQVDKLRFACGTQYRLKKAISLEFGYIYQQEINQESPKQTNMFKLGMSYDLGSLKKKKK